MVSDGSLSFLAVLSLLDLHQCVHVCDAVCVFTGMSHIHLVVVQHLIFNSRWVTTCADSRHKSGVAPYASAVNQCVGSVSIVSHVSQGEVEGGRESSNQSQTRPAILCTRWGLRVSSRVSSPIDYKSSRGIVSIVGWFALAAVSCRQQSVWRCWTRSQKVPLGNSSVERQLARPHA